MPGRHGAGCANVWMLAFYRIEHCALMREIRRRGLQPGDVSNLGQFLVEEHGYRKNSMQRIVRCALDVLGIESIKDAPAKGTDTRKRSGRRRNRSWRDHPWKNAALGRKPLVPRKPPEPQTP